MMDFIDEVPQIKRRCEHQFNWANTTVIELCKTIEQLQAENNRLIDRQKEDAWIIREIRDERNKLKEALEMAWEILDSIETDLVRTKVKEALGK